MKQCSTQRRVRTLANRCRRIGFFVAAFVLTVLATNTFAQGGGNITGTVKDKSGNPIIGVAVTIPNTARGTSTDIDGRYTIKASAKESLNFSYIGYQSQLIQINNRTTIDVVLTEDNTSLEEVVMTLRCHKEIAVDTGIDARLITKASHLVSSLMNMPVQPNKAIVGRNAFAHSSGIHQDGVLKDRQTYEIIDPQDIGLNESVIALTARSGRAALVHRLELLGYDLTQEELDATYAKFLELADKKKEIHDYDLLYLVGDIDRMKQQSVSLKFLQVTTGTLVPTATVVLKFGDHERMAIATGNGPVDAAVSAIKTLINEKVVLMEFLMQAITRGSNDVGRVHVQVQCGSRTVHGFAAHTDTTRASIEAFLDALRVLNVTERKEKEE